MKQVYFFLLVFFCFSGSALAKPSLSPVQSSTIIILDVVLEVTPTDYMGAQSVDISILDAHGNVLAAGNTRPGQTATFSYTGHEKKVVQTYHMGFGSNDVIIVDVIVQ